MTRMGGHGPVRTPSLGEIAIWLVMWPVIVIGALTVGFLAICSEWWSERPWME